MQNGRKFCDFGHAHFYVFPRYENDGFGWTYGSEEKDVNTEIYDCSGHDHYHTMRAYRLAVQIAEQVLKGGWMKETGFDIGI